MKFKPGAPLYDDVIHKLRTHHYLSRRAAKGQVTRVLKQGFKTSKHKNILLAELDAHYPQRLSKTSAITPSNAPRTKEELLKLKRGQLCRLGTMLGLCDDERQEQAFHAMSPDQQAEVLVASLVLLDRAESGSEEEPKNDSPKRDENADLKEMLEQERLKNQAYEDTLGRLRRGLMATGIPGVEPCMTLERMISVVLGRIHQQKEEVTIMVCGPSSSGKSALIQYITESLHHRGIDVSTEQGNLVNMSAQHQRMKATAAHTRVRMVERTMQSGVGGPRPPLYTGAPMYCHPDASGTIDTR